MVSPDITVMQSQFVQICNRFDALNQRFHDLGKLLVVVFLVRHFFPSQVFIERETRYEVDNSHQVSSHIGAIWALALGL
jgi:hypothetical protein